MIFFILTSLGCSNTKNEVNKDSRVQIINTEKDKIFKGYILLQDGGFDSLNNKMSIYYISEDDLSIEDYNSVIKKRLIDEGWIFYKSYYDTDIYCDKSKKRSINIAKPARNKDIIKPSLGVVQSYNEWNIGFFISKGGAFDCS